MKVRFSPRARRRVKIVATWWRENRPAAATLFDDELRAVVERLTSLTVLDSEYKTVGEEVIRRTLLPKSGQHVYYSVDEEDGVIIIHTVWGARRGRAPKL